MDSESDEFYYQVRMNRGIWWYQDNSHFIKLHRIQCTSLRLFTSTNQISRHVYP